MRTPFIAGNWKMNMTAAEAEVFCKELKDLYKKQGEVKTAICAPFVRLAELVEYFKDSEIKVGAQNCHFEDSGDFTGEVSVPMLEELGIDYCIIGHSERREYFAETDETVNKKLLRLFDSTILPILCVGEKLEERDAGKEKEVVGAQIKKDLDGLTADNVKVLTIAYEPIWAIGTGRTASPEQAEEMCGYIRSVIAEMYDADTAEAVTIQYGGSMKPANASDLMAMEDIDGGLIGGASLKTQDFNQIIEF